MLVLKSIAKVVKELALGTLFMCLALAAFIAACFVFGLAVQGLDWLIGAIFGAGWAAFKTWFGGAVIYILGTLAIGGIIGLFVLEVKGEYDTMKAAKEGQV